MNRVLRLTAIATIAVFAVSTPTLSLGASSADKKQIARTFKQLKRLPNAGASAPIVRQLVRKLSILNPKGASTYYKFGIRKLPPVQAEQAARQILRQLLVIVKKSGLPANQVSRITRVIEKTFAHFVPPTPSPTPYQASVPAESHALLG